jgi:NTE family protein
MSCHSGEVRVGVVLSAGGLRGAVHVGVLRQLVRHGIPIDVIVGVSAGAVVAAYYAAVGLDFDELIADACAFRGRHLLAHSLNVRLHRRFDRWLAPLSGVIPDRLRRLEAATFDRLHHGVRSLGIVCHDLTTGRPRYFSSGIDQGARLDDVVRASASIPILFPPVPVVCDAQQCSLTDGGISDPLPLAFARREPLGATHLIVSDTGRQELLSPSEEIVCIQSRPASTSTLCAPRHGLLSAVREGELALSDEVVARIRGWFNKSGLPSAS